MRRRPDLAPAGKPGVAFQPQDAAGDGFAGLPLSNGLGDLACQRQVPQGQAGDVHGSGPGMPYVPAR